MDGLKGDIEAISRIDSIQTILDVITRTTGMGFAAVARVTESRWVACAVRDDIAFGLKPGGELEIGTTICNSVRRSGERVVFDDATADAVYAGHVAPALYGFRSYVSVPIRRSNGEIFGTLCAIDAKPVAVSAEQTISMFELFATLIGLSLDGQERLEESQASLHRARMDAELREQFIGILGHDLRNPLASLHAGINMLSRNGADERNLKILQLMGQSVSRMTGMIDNLLDFARGRLAGGIPINPRNHGSLAADLEQVVEELRSGWPDRTIDLAMRLDAPVFCDKGRIAQLLSNLLANALAHGEERGVVRVSASAQGGTFELSVANAGTPFSEETVAYLFQPFKRTPDRMDRGLGLGLYIAAEIARAHRGELTYEPSENEIRFVLRMPASRPTVT